MQPEHDDEKKAEHSAVEMPPSPASDDDTPFDDSTTSRAIDDIVAKEGDVVLAAEDEKKQAQEAVVKPRRRSFLYRWWHNGWARSITLLIVCIGIAGAAATPVSRYWILNTAGVQASSSVNILDDKTGLPLKGVRFTMDGKSADANEAGIARLSGLRLGPQTLRIEQPGFSVVEQTVTVGWGSNPLGAYKLKSTGVRLTIEVRDFLSGKPIEGAQAASGESTAVSDKNGKLVITLASSDEVADPVTLAKPGYRTEQVTLDADLRKTTKASLVYGQKTVYVHNQSGKYDVYKSDLDGKNPQVLLPGTGSETSNMSLAVSPDGTKVAVVSTRGNQRDAGGFLLSTLLIVNISDGEAVSIAKAAQLQLVDWIGSRLVYQQVASDAATPANARYSVIGYSTSDGSRVQLGSAKKLNAVFSAHGAVYFAVAADPADSAFKPAFYKVNPDGGGKQAVIDMEIWGGYRPHYTALNVQSATDGWLSYDLTTDRYTASTDPGSAAGRLYVADATGSKHLWIESRDGQGILQVYDKATAKDARVIAQAGLTYPVRWLSNDIVVYRVVTGGEVADYAVSLLGGPAAKIANVVNTYGFTSGQ